MPFTFVRAKWHGAVHRRPTEDDTMPTAPPAGDRAVFDAFLARRHLDPGKFVLRFQQISEPAPWKGVDTLVTVTCAALRMSRTYASGAGHGHWLADFAQDVESGIFPARSDAPIPLQSESAT